MQARNATDGKDVTNFYYVNVQAANLHKTLELYVSRYNEFIIL